MDRREYFAAWRKCHLDHLLEYRREWRRAHAEEQRKYHREYARKNYDPAKKRVIAKRYLDAHRAQSRAYARAYGAYIARPNIKRRRMEAQIAALGFNIFTMAGERPVWPSRENTKFVSQRFMEVM